MYNMYNSSLISKPVRRLWRHFCSDSLFRNSVYLMLSTGVQAVFGFLFWILAARLYSPEQIGIGSTLISATVFISYISLLGFNSTLVKFLPGPDRRNEKINSSLTLVLGASLLVATIYLLLLSRITPELGFLAKSPIYALAFVMFSAFSAVNLLTDSIFIAYRASKYNFIVYTLQSAAKLSLPILFVGLGAFGIFTASGLAAGMAAFLSIFFAAKKFNYVPKLSVHKDIVKSFWKFSSSSYIANFLNIIPPAVMPIIILDKLGAAQAGYYYLAFTICNLLYAVVYSVSQSLFAEGSYGEASLRNLFKRSVMIVAAIMVPASVALAFAGPYILQIFGKSYGEEAGQAITVLALSAPAVSAYILSTVLLRILNKNFLLVFMNVVYAVTMIGLAVLWTGKGLVWVGYAWMIGNVAAALVAFLSIWIERRKH